LTQYIELFEDSKGVIRVRIKTEHPQENNPEEEVQVMAYKYSRSEGRGDSKVSSMNNSSNSLDTFYKQEEDY